MRLCQDVCLCVRVCVCVCECGEKSHVQIGVSVGECKFMWTFDKGEGYSARRAYMKEEKEKRRKKNTQAK